MSEIPQNIQKQREITQKIEEKLKFNLDGILADFKKKIKPEADNISLREEFEKRIKRNLIKILLEGFNKNKQLIKDYINDKYSN